MPSCQKVHPSIRSPIGSEWKGSYLVSKGETVSTEVRGLKANSIKISSTEELRIIYQNMFNNHIPLMIE